MHPITLRRWRMDVSKSIVSFGMTKLGQFQKVMSCITGMVTRPTIDLTILNSCLRLNTNGNIATASHAYQ